MTAAVTDIQPTAGSPTAWSTAVTKPRLAPALVLIAAFWITWLVMRVFYPGTFVQFMVAFTSPMICRINFCASSRLPGSTVASTPNNPGSPGV